jgi:hypothetical protein
MTKGMCVSGIAQTHRCQVRATLPKFVFMIAQLRDVLTAKDSPVVPQKNQHDRRFSPQGTESHLLPICIWHYGRKRAAIRVHADTF